MNRDQVTNLSVDILKVHPENTKYFDDIEGEAYERFKRSIEEDGIITPLIVSPDMTIISGHQRYHAARDLGIKLVPVIIRDELIDEDERLKRLLAANFGRLKNNPVKQGKVFKKYEELRGVRQGSANKGMTDVTSKFEVTREQIAEELGVSLTTIHNLKKLSELSPELQQLIEDGEVRYTTALNVWGKLSNEDQEKFIQTMGKEQITNITAKETQELVNRYKEQVESYKHQQDLLREENKSLRSRGPQVIEKEVVPDEVKQQLKGLEQTERELNILKSKIKDNSSYSKTKEELERELQELIEKKNEQEKLYNEMTLMANRAKQLEDNETTKRRLIRNVTVGTDELKRSKYKIIETYEQIHDLNEPLKKKLLSEADFLLEMSELLRGMVEETKVVNPQHIVLEGELVNE